MLPNLIIIGAMKCGTTSLHFYLSLHPEVQMSKLKELDFFAERYNWSKGFKWYESNFLEQPEKCIYGESSPNYTNCTLSPEVPRRMHDLVPDAKLIYVVRDPIKRMQAHYIHKISNGSETREINDAFFDIQSKRYFPRSLYYSQLEKYLEYYPLSQILIVTTEDLRNHRQQTLQKIFEFLEVNPNFYSQLYNLERHKSRTKRRKNELGQKIAQSTLGKAVNKLPNSSTRRLIKEIIYYPFSTTVSEPTLKPELIAFLKEQLQDDVNKLRQLTGRQFSSWSI